MEDVDEKVKVVFGGVTLAYTSRAKRVSETSHLMESGMLVEIGAIFAREPNH